MARYIVMEYEHIDLTDTAHMGAVLLPTKSANPFAVRMMNSVHNRTSKAATAMHGQWHSITTRPVGIMHTTMNGTVKQFVAYRFLDRNVRDIGT